MQLLPPRPSGVNPDDPRFLAEIKGWANKIVDYLRKNRVSGDQATTWMTNTPAGRVVHSHPAIGKGDVKIVAVVSVHPASPTGAGDVRMFTGLVYPNGSVADPTNIVTIRLMGLAAGFDNFPTTPQLGIGQRQTWTNASAVEVDEIVYEVPLWTWTASPLTTT